MSTLYFLSLFATKSLAKNRHPPLTLLEKSFPFLIRVWRERGEAKTSQRGDQRTDFAASASRLLSHYINAIWQSSEGEKPFHTTSENVYAFPSMETTAFDAIADTKLRRLSKRLQLAGLLTMIDESSLISKHIFLCLSMWLYLYQY